MIVAYETISGTKAGLWYERLIACRTHLGIEGGLLFRHLDGTKWTSNYFRTTHVYPLLQLQRAAGDPILSLCSDEPGNRIEDVYWSMNIYRRGGRSHSTRGHSSTVRKAQKEEVVAHGRWKVRNEDMPLRYQEWEAEERIKITLLCM